MIKKKKSRPAADVDSSSMADIAFLLLIFFLVTSTIASDKGLAVMLPPKVETTDVKIKERNIFNILVNSEDMILAENNPAEVGEIREQVKAFITNNGKDPKSSEEPNKAIISLKTDRGTSYEIYIALRNELSRAYTELRAAHLKMSVESYKALDPNNPAHKAMIKDAKDAYKNLVSDAEPSEAGK
ncbi:ExbD/TolR family protein [Sediminitomix flava]|uniref:Biopolymer transport protein ExbD n=1 Tax=Sediminitomix flava TaxID=379075 RepID=A0A315ZBG7_SEDFL|nr:biopolymer transporter ExbD [Sediminitomix flava]PWJ42926.1 biopolymer transport protein ExbD [Sediminitomix flava]